MSIFELLYLMLTGSLIVALGAALTKRARISYTAATVATLLAFSTYIWIWYEARRPPLFGVFEAGITIVLIMNLLATISDFRRLRADRFIRKKQSSWVWSANLALLFLMAFYPKTLNPDYYMYDDLSVVVFFHFRIIASALFFYATVMLWYCYFKNDHEYQHLARNYLLSGAVIFLMSEFSGSWWCLNWWGDSWHWSKGFLKASCLFLSVMLVCHLPVNWGNSSKTRTIASSVPAVITFWVLFIH